MRQAMGRAVTVTVGVLLAAALAAGCADITGTGGPGAGAAGPASPGGASAAGRPAAQAGNTPLRATASGAGTSGAGTSATGTSGTAAPRAANGAAATPSGHPEPLAGKVIVLDPGHNGANWSHPAIINRLVNVITEWKPCDTTGAETDAGYPEHAFNFDVATRLARLLRAEGATVVLTRPNDTGVGPCVTQRAAIGNRAHAAAAISIHADGGPPSGTGFEVIEPGLIPGHNAAIIGPSDRLGLDIRNAYHRITGEPYSDYVGTQGLDVRTDLGGLNLSTVPKVFIECANMRNAADAAKLTNPAFRERIAVALAAGFTAFLAPGSHP
jgi:N-acetylmuramoyl-L-alanine amidase